MAVRTCVAGATGWTGSAVVRAVLASTDFDLVGAVARRAVGRDVGSTLGGDPAGVLVVATVSEALQADCDVLIDFTHPSVVKDNVQTAIAMGVSCVIGTSGLAAADYADIDGRAREAGVGVIAAGNFSLTAALAKHFAGIAARHIPHWEIIDYAHGSKPDVPSGTANELADFLGDVAENEMLHPIDRVLGPREARGATIGGTQVHSIRLPSFTLSFETVFGLPNERLSIRHDAGSGADPYVNGTLLAAGQAPGISGVVRGLDTLLFGSTRD